MSSTIVFVDFQKAFDSVNRDAMSQILAFYGVPSCLINAIMALYKGTTARVRLANGTCSSYFPTTTGVLQGDTLSPFLFVIVLDFVLREVFENDSHALQITNTSPAKLGALAYADDIAIIAPSPGDAQSILTRLEVVSRKVGLIINAAKTEYVILPMPETHQPLQVAGRPIKQVSSFVYLGSQVPDSEAAFKERRLKAWAAAAKLRNVANSQAAETLKVSLFKATVESVLLYASETLSVSKTLARKIDAAHSALLRYSMGIHWPQLVTNEAIYQRAGCARGSKVVKSRRLLLYGHVMRHRKDLPAGLVLHTIAGEKYRVGGHRRITYEKTIQQDLEDLSANTPNLYWDKAKWQDLCDRAMK
jgi:hypothetical protein